MRRLSDEEKWRRGTLQPCRVRVEEPLALDEEGFDAWLEGLSPLAQAEGRRFLLDAIPGCREAFRAYLEHEAAWIRAYPLRNAPMDEKIREHAAGVRLLEAVKWRWR
jgi:hypothetical protein